MSSPAGRASDYYTGTTRHDYLTKVVEPASVRWTAMNLPLYQRYVQPTDTVLDFGCGTGRLLTSLTAGRRLGVEVNTAASSRAADAGVEIFSTTRDVPDAVADTVVSHHCIEHVLSPFDELVELRRVLKPRGRFVALVPLENWRTNNFPMPSDPDNHLFAWTPLTFSNLMREAGFEVEQSVTLTKAPLPQRLNLTNPKANTLWHSSGADRLYGAIRGLRQVYTVASNPA